MEGHLGNRDGSPEGIQGKRLNPALLSIFVDDEFVGLAVTQRNLTQRAALQ
jgi:hypothetical protein